MALVLVVLATGCKPLRQAQVASQSEDLALQVRILNYMDEPLGDVYVNRIWAGGMRSHAGGFGVAGSVGLPAKWHAGLTVDVEWQDDALYRKDRDASYKAQVPVEPYDVTNDHPAVLWLAFMPGNNLKAIASSYGPGHLKFPADWRYPEDACRANSVCTAKFYPQRVPLAPNSGNP
ncbi:DUF3304 domain-containing protein [Ralstonia sp. 22086]|uniref:DUF3304 domain-containing protein n=1 Tax=Ralstonia sp. 22086 TaxID=3453870 RepID=UPI003F860A2F